MASIGKATGETAEASALPIDLPSLRERCMGDEAFVGKVLTMFRNQAPASLAKAEAALTAGDLPTAATVAHSLKGMAANVSATALSKEAGELETASKSASATAATAALARVKTQMERCLVYIPTIGQGSP